MPTAGLVAASPPAPIPDTPDRVRMQAERVRKIREGMAAKGIDALVLLGNNNVMYATGIVFALADGGRSTFERPVAALLADDEIPHVFVPHRERDQLGVDLPDDHVHGPLYLDFDEGVAAFVDQLAGLMPPGGRVALDEWTHAMRRETSVLFRDGGVGDAGGVISQAKLIKTPDEVAAMREVERITERGIAEAQRRLAPGVRQVDLTAVFLRTVFEAGADANLFDPMWQVMEPRIADGPWTSTGDLACPLLSSERRLERGDVVWSDVSVCAHGLHSDFGRTWIVGQEPDERQRGHFARWREIIAAVLDVTRAGATNAELTRAAIDANGGTKPWMSHFYLGHGLGIDAAEMPFVGSDIGEAFDEGYVLQAGMVLVLEPLVWEDGYAGFRAEEVVLITDDGWAPITDYPYDPF